MKIVRTIQFQPNSKEELLPDYEDAFPYISSIADLSHYPDAFVPWHWHKAVELFVVRSGSLTYYLPGRQETFHEGEAGFLNSDILHMTKTSDNNTVQQLHIFDPSLIAGNTAGTIYKKYVFPIICNPSCTLLHFRRDETITSMIENAFSIREDDNFEIRIRNALSEIWMKLPAYASIDETMPDTENKADTKLKEMIAWIYENYDKNIAVTDIAKSAFISERECYRIFKDALHTTPNAFVTNYRIEVAAELLCKTNKTISSIGYESGLGASSHFIQLFKKEKGCTPAQYRTRWKHTDFQ